MIQQEVSCPRGRFESLAAYHARLANERLARLMLQLLELDQKGVHISIARAVGSMGGIPGVQDQQAA